MPSRHWVENIILLHTSNVSCMARALQVNYNKTSLPLFRWIICDFMYKKMLENCKKKNYNVCQKGLLVMSSDYMN